MSFSINMGRNVGKNISKSLGGKYSQKFLDHAKYSATDALKVTSKRVIQKPVEKTGDLIDIKISNRITKVPKSSQQNTSGTITNDDNIEIPKERYIFPKEDRKFLMI